MSSFWYIATPYSKYPAGREQAFIDASKIAAKFVKAGIPAFSPIAHTHPVAEYGEIDPYDHKIWLPFDAPFMALAYGLIVCKLDGWDKSIGIAHEIEAFKKAGKPVLYMEFPVGETF